MGRKEGRQGALEQTLKALQNLALDKILIGAAGLVLCLVLSRILMRLFGRFLDRAKQIDPSLYSMLKPGGTTVRPVSGGVIRGFDSETPVLWEALSCVQLHAAVDLAGEVGEKVHCVMDGTVSGTVRDELWGWRVAVAQTDGQQAVYAGLAACDVSAGQNVTRGQTIGTLLERIPCEAELGAHLHLELTCNGERRDPMEILPDEAKGTET